MLNNERHVRLIQFPSNPIENEIVHDVIVIVLLWLRCCHFLMIIKTHYLYPFNSFSAGDVIFRNNQVPYVLSHHRYKANFMNVSTEWVNVWFQWSIINKYQHVGYCLDIEDLDRIL